VTVDGLLGVLFPGGAAPDYYEGRLLSQPIGYANGMGMLAVFGLVLAFAFASHGNAVARHLSAALLVPFAAALALTGSRGAAAAFVAALVLLLTRKDGAPSLAVLVLPAAAGVVATLSHVTDAASAPDVVAHDGRSVAAVIAVLALVNTALPTAQRRSRLPLTAAVAIAVLGCAALPFAAYDRLPFWRAALVDYAAHPLLGSGPGSFAAAWLRYRDVADSTLDAHSLYLQTLAEIGPLGLLALLVALAVPLSGIRRTRSRYAPAVAAAYAAFLFHAAIDWDWQLPAVTLVGVVLGATLIVDSRPEDNRSRFPVSAAGIATALAAVAACAMLVGNRTLVAASHAARAHEWPQARALAARAAWWQPWSAEPLLVLGQAQAATGDARAARATFIRAARLAPSDWRARYDVDLATRAGR
jgi:hypothetical protein